MVFRHLGVKAWQTSEPDFFFALTSRHQGLHSMALVTVLVSHGHDFKPVCWYVFITMVLLIMVRHLMALLTYGYLRVSLEKGH
jgi:hypothetical protein